MKRFTFDSYGYVSTRAQADATANLVATTTLRGAWFKTGNDQDLPKELVSDAEGALVKRATDVSPGGALTLRFAEGTAEAVATGAERCVKAGSKPQPKAKT